MDRFLLPLHPGLESGNTIATHVTYVCIQLFNVNMILP